MPGWRFFTKRSAAEPLRLGALGVSVAIHLAALMVLGAIHFGRQTDDGPGGLRNLRSSD